MGISNWNSISNYICLVTKNTWHLQGIMLNEEIKG
jgi:hypothetical protein